MKTYRLILIGVLFLIAVTLACQATDQVGNLINENTSIPTPSATALPVSPNQPGEISGEEPVFIIGNIPYTSPFFLNTASEPFVMLEDQIGFIQRDPEHIFNLEGQAIGPVEIDDDLKLTYGLALPSVPQGTFVDLDNDEQEEQGVQVFAIAYWSNTWGGPFLEERDGTGWSTAYASTITDPENEHEIIGGTLVVWAPDEDQGFPTGFGDDGLLFTEDDPSANIPAGYTLVDLNQTPFTYYKESRPQVILIEGDLAVNDFANQDYVSAFNQMFEQASREYPFTVEKNISWQSLYDEYLPQISTADSDEDYYRALRNFTYEIPDGHVGVSLNPDVFFQERGGGFGINLTELTDSKVVVSNIIPGGVGDLSGIELGAEIIAWDGKPVAEAINQVTPYFGPYSTEHTRRLGQVNFLTRTAPGSTAAIRYINPGESEIIEEELIAEVEYDSLFHTLPGFNEDELGLPIQAEVLEGSGLGYLRVITFNDDYHLMAQLWETHIQALIDNEVPGLIIDLRSNGGGSSGLAYDFAGYFFEDEFILYDSAYFNEQTGQFEFTDIPAQVKPTDLLYDGPIAVIIGPDCVSACEGFAYALSYDQRSVVIGHYPTAGAFGEVGRGQYEMPDELSMQFPTGRPVTPEGELLIEGTGVIPDILVPVTLESALGQIDTVLEAAIEYLVNEIY